MGSAAHGQFRTSFLLRPPERPPIFRFPRPLLPDDCSRSMSLTQPAGDDLFEHVLRLVDQAHERACDHLADRIERRRATLLDSALCPIAVCTVEGLVIHRNPQLEEALREADDPRALGDAITSCGRRAAATSDGVSTVVGVYRMEGRPVPGGVVSDTPAVVVTLRDPHAVGQPDWRERFPLTPREVQVTALLAQRRSNAVIARSLGISPNTARRHTAQVLHKLGIRSRREVRDRVLDIENDVPVTPVI